MTQGTKTSIWIFVSLFSIYLITASGRIDSGDGLLIFNVSRSMLENGDVNIPAPDPDAMAFDAQARPIGLASELGLSQGIGRDGKYYAITGIGHSLLVVPLLALGQWVAKATSFIHPLWLMQFTMAMVFNPLVTALNGVLVYLVARRLLFSQKTGILLAVLYGLATMAWVYSKSSFSDPLVSLLLFYAFYSLLIFKDTTSSRWLWLGGGAVGYAILTKTYAILVVPIFAIYLLYSIKKEPKRFVFWQLMAFLIPVGIGLVGVVAFNWYRFGVLLDTSYRGEGWSTPFLTGLYGLLASPGKSYFLYNPVMFAALIGFFPFYRHYKPEFWLIVAVALVHLILLAHYDHWHGGGCWGPRLLLHLTPFLILPLGLILETISEKSRLLNLLLAVLIAVSVLVQVEGLSVGFGRYLRKVYDQSVTQFHQRVMFEPAYSPLVGQWQELREVVNNLRNPVNRARIAQLAQHRENDMLDEDDMALIASNVPDFWFIHLYLIDF
jgi:hypothetical protein